MSGRHGAQRLACLVLSMYFCLMNAAVFARGQSVQPVGVPLVTTISFGDDYSTPVELYDAKITVLEVIRGEKAWAFLSKASSSNQPVGTDQEYIVARVQFEYSARGAPGDKSYTLREDQFTSESFDGNEYRTPAVRLPAPGLNNTLHSGDSAEGWVAFAVARNDAKPRMVFKEDVQTLLRRGAGVRFKLY
jgi:hypothetical protein